MFFILKPMMAQSTNRTHALCTPFLILTAYILKRMNRWSIMELRPRKELVFFLTQKREPITNISAGILMKPGNLKCESKKFNFNMADSSITAVTDVKEFCWKTRKSDEILIYINYSGMAGTIRKEPIYFIAADQSDRLLIQYSILVNQYSISKEEYDFWNNLKQVNEGGGDIFAEQPFTVLSNIHNVSDPTERVLGYFQVSAVKQKRKYISFSEIEGMNLPYYQYQCERLVKDPTDIPHGYESPPPTWDELYEMYCITSDYYFVEPQYSEGTNNLEKMVFARPECADCTITGTITKPDFWVDLK